MSALARALVRTEWLLLTVFLAFLVFRHGSGISWPRFAVAFVAIDLLGYLPGALAFRRARGGAIAPLYHWLYNLTHNFVTAAVVVAVWASALGRLEWAMLALPLHLAGDRGVFGNGFKPAHEPFERAAERPLVVS
jgi:hypothetical protein